MANKCRDCGFKAAPKYTIKFEGEPNLYFCKKCSDKAMVVWSLIKEALDKSLLTEEQVQEAIDKVKGNKSSIESE